MAGTVRPELPMSASRRLTAGPAAVWAALTTKEALESWWSPEDLRTSVRRLDVRPGGQVELHVRYVPAMLTPNASKPFEAAGIPVSFDLRGRFRAVIPERLIEFDLTLELGRKGAGIAMVTRFELRPTGDGTEVRIEGFGADTPHWRTLGQQNLEAQLERLERRASGDGPRGS